MGNRESWVDTFVARDVIMESKLPQPKRGFTAKLLAINRLYTSNRTGRDSECSPVLNRYGESGRLGVKPSTRNKMVYALYDPQSRAANVAGDRPGLAVFSDNSSFFASNYSTVTVTGWEGIPFATTTRLLGPVSIVSGTSKKVETICEPV